VADDAGIGQETFDVGRPEFQQGLDLEPGKGAAEIVALPQYRDPGQARLEALEAELLEQVAVVRRRAAPFGVVVGLVQRVAAGPGAARQRAGR
jgi:hypothetical protein